MAKYEYRVIPAPARGQKIKGVKKTEDRFAQTLSGLMNELASEGWEYIRADTLPCEQRVGFTRKKTVYQNMLVFRREEVGVEDNLPVCEPEEVPSLDEPAAPEEDSVVVTRRISRPVTTRPLGGIKAALHTSGDESETSEDKNAAAG